MTATPETPGAALAAAERALVHAHDELAATIAAQALSRIPPGDDAMAARLLCTRAVAAGNLGRVDDAAVHALRAAEAARRAGDAVTAGHALAIAAFNLAEDGYGSRAVGALLDAAHALDAAGKPNVSVVNAQVMVAQAAVAVGDVATGRSFIARAVAGAHAIRDPAAQSYAMSVDLRMRVRAALDAERRSPEDGLRAHTEAIAVGGPTLAICDSAGDVAAGIDVRALLALSLASIGETGQAERRLGEVHRLCAEHDLPPERIVHLARARALLTREAPEQALAVLDEALRTPLDDLAGDRSAWIHLERARAHEMLGDLAAVAAELRRALMVEQGMHLAVAERLGDSVAAQLRRQRAEHRALHHERRANRLARVADEDPATGLLTRRAFQERMDRVAAAGVPWALVMVDVDHFKRLNDRFGHPVGDDVLATVARLIRSACRDADPAGRHAGDEFVVGLPGVGAEVARACAQRIAAAVRSHPWSMVAPGLTVSVSVGVAASGGSGASLRDVITDADRALYGAKGPGRDGAHVAPEAG